MKRKSFLALLLCVVLMLGAVPFSAAAEGEVVTLRFMAYNPAQSRATYLEFLADQLPGIEIVFEYVSLDDDFNGILNAQLEAGAGPDIIELGGETKLLAAAGRLLDLSDQEFVAKYAQAGLTPYTWEGKVFGTPLQSWYEGIFYNKAIFAEHGISVPKSLDAFIQVHKDLEAAGVKPQTMGASSWEPMMKQSIGVANNEFYSDPANAGFDALFNTSEVSLAESWLPAVTAWAKVIEEGCLTTDMLGMSYEQAQAEFASGGAAMWESGPWAESDLFAANPDLDLGMFPIPGVSEGPGWLVGGPGSSLVINAKSEKIEAALQVLALTATPEAQIALTADWPGSSFLIGVNLDLGDVYADCAEAFAAGNVYAPWVAVWDFGNPVVEAYGKSLQEVLSGTKTVAEALADADRMNAIMIDEIKN
ncbi:MAG: ABC transporter substrate-binding protein [Clostridia bacterium]|nr:ABC transporter substrate-binding protein [Clostridia bacterium]